MQVYMEIHTASDPLGRVTFAPFRKGASFDVLMSVRPPIRPGSHVVSIRLLRMPRPFKEEAMSYVLGDTRIQPKALSLKATFRRCVSQPTFACDAVEVELGSAEVEYNIKQGTYVLSACKARSGLCRLVQSNLLKKPSFSSRSRQEPSKWVLP